MADTSVYSKIAQRTKGEIYIGVVGPVRTGKSTFIKRFMDLLMLEHLEDSKEKQRTIDELPQSAQGKMIMTTEPKFIPKNPMELFLEPGVPVKMKLIDCVGYLIEGVSGHIEDGKERMVKTPWFEYEIPFEKAAMVGTEKVIREHATVGIVITTDGSFTDLPRDNYKPAEERTVSELKKLGKPFVVLYNTPKPYSSEAIMETERMKEQYQVGVLPVNCEQLKAEDIRRILQTILYEFPINEMNFYIPKWVEMLSSDHEVKTEVIQCLRKIMEESPVMRDVIQKNIQIESELIKGVFLEQTDLSAGILNLRVEMKEALYYKNMSELAGISISGEYELISLIKNLSKMKEKYDMVSSAMDHVEAGGYGVVVPTVHEIQIEEPVLMRQGNKFGVKLKAFSPSIHMIRARIETEISPIIGSEEQANDLIQYIRENQNTTDGLWKTNVFGKSIGELLEDGIRKKLDLIDEESQQKLQESMQKIVNDSNGGLVCIII